MTDWIKLFHLYVVVLAIGAASAKYMLLRSQRRAKDPRRAQAGEEIALLLTKRMEAPLLLSAWILGFILAFAKAGDMEGYWKQGWLHTKILITTLMLGLSHMSAAVLRRLGKLRAASAAEAQIAAAQSRLGMFGVTMMLLTFVAFYLVIFQRF
jgi:uncharacterized membrane protein